MTDGFEIAGKPVRITWGPRLEQEYTGTAISVDKLGTLTFKRDEDGYLGIAGSGAWVALTTPKP